jgi:nucleotide-binding universal stress UspA family protein
MIALKRILVATDFGEAADAALVYGRALGGTFKASVLLLHVVNDVLSHMMAAEAPVTVLPDVQKAMEEAARCRLEERLIH